MATQLRIETADSMTASERFSSETAILHSHLLAITDDTGVFQHAKGMIPWREHGYCSDDVARALVFAVRTGYAPRLATTCMSFLLDAAVPGVGFRNFMSFDRRWLEDVGSSDCQGRVVWALGITSRMDPFGTLAMPANFLLKEIVPIIDLWSHHPRAWAYALIGLSATQEPYVRPLRDRLAKDLLKMYRRNATPEWPWFEHKLTYANALLAHAVILQRHLEGAVEIGLSALEWLFKNQYEGGVLSFCGNSRSWVRGDRPIFDQQPIEAQELSSACLAAFLATRDQVWIDRQQACLDWFHRKNLLHEQLGDPSTGACADGLGASGPSLNCGAESTLAYLLTQSDARDLRFAFGE